MSRQDGLSDWIEHLSSRMPHLKRPQAVVLAMWSYGIAVTQSCSRSTVALFLALLLGQKEGTVGQRLREWCYEAEAKRGKRRQALEVETCFVPLLCWILSLWSGTTLALTLDASSLKDRFVVLCISVVYRGCAIPVAWTILKGQQKGAWKTHWLRMLNQLGPAIPEDWTVLVLTDRGLYARWLFRCILRQGWHPYMRINRGAKFRPAGQSNWYWLSTLVAQVGEYWCGAGTAFSSHNRQLACTLVAWWGEGYEEAWFILTDLSPDSCDAAWYGLRTWCEQGFKCTKRGGWQWQNTRMIDPARAERLYLAMAVATLWMLSVGCDLEVGPTDAWPNLPDLRPLLGIKLSNPKPRRARLLRLGRLWLLARLIAHCPIPLPCQLVPEPWPVRPHLCRPKTYP